MIEAGRIIMGKKGSLREVGVHFKQYAMVAAGGLGMTGGHAPSGPLQAQIGINDPCNHRCVFCWDHPPEDRENEDTTRRFGLERPGVMSLEQFKGIVDDLYKLGTRRIDLIGRGEPLLNRAALEMIRYVKGRNMQLLLCTNASRLSESIAEGMVAAGMDRVNVSLNAGTPETYPHIHVTETPENYLRVKRNLRYLSDCKIAAGSDVPYLSLSFVISSKNYFELASMVSVASEVGAQEAAFVHTVLHDGTPDLALSQEEYRELLASIPAAQAKATALDVQTNLRTFAATAPPYMQNEVVGPLVVPCYVGWYFTVILGNGSVLPCCQCTEPIDQVSKDRRFSEVWASENYTGFRKAAKQLPMLNERLKTCECGNCQLRARNIAIYNFLHPWKPIEAGDDVQTFTPKDFLRKMQGYHGRPPS
jgi:MoaA/NifB/PqqE/SkfB family radical SAM enzyme